MGDLSAPVAGRPVVAIVGRPNVGKSTLMNRILGRREAIVEKTPGVTRDRKSLEAEWQGIEFLLTDTGGWMADRHGDDLDAKVSRQAEQAMTDADVVLFVVDGTSGLTSEDDRVAHLLQRRKGPVLVVVNKLDHDRRDPDAAEFWSLGLGQPYPISALHGRGTGDLLDAIVAELPEAPAADPDVAATAALDADVTSIALVGRPNVGKSTLFNRLIGSDRSVVHDRPGTTATPSTPRSTPSSDDCGSSTPPGCAARRRWTRPPSTTRRCAPSTRSTKPTWPCS